MALAHKGQTRAFGHFNLGHVIGGELIEIKFSQFCLIVGHAVSISYEYSALIKKAMNDYIRSFFAPVETCTPGAKLNASATVLLLVP
jgi:hypothetical protein